MEDYSEIISMARELSRMIENHEITVRYKESIEKMKGDMKAQQLLSELVMIGRDLNENLTSGTRPGVAELEVLKQEFDGNETVKNHILAQKEYLNLIKLVQERIKNPLH